LGVGTSFGQGVAVVAFFARQSVFMCIATDRCCAIAIAFKAVGSSTCAAVITFLTDQGICISISADRYCAVLIACCALSSRAVNAIIASLARGGVGEPISARTYSTVDITLCALCGNVVDPIITAFAAVFYSVTARGQGAVFPAGITDKIGIGTAFVAFFNTVIEVPITTGGGDTGIEAGIVVALIAIITGFITFDNEVSTSRAGKFLAGARNASFARAFTVVGGKALLFLWALLASKNACKEQSDAQRIPNHKRYLKRLCALLQMS